VLWRSLPAIVAGRVPRLPNDLAQGSYYGARTPEDGRIDWAQPAARVYDLIRAVAPPYPGAFVDVAGRRLVVAAARRSREAASTGEGALTPGLHVLGERIVGACGDGGTIDVRELRDGRDILTPRALQALLSHAT